MDELHTRAAHIQALLFMEGGSLTLASLGKTLACSEETVRAALSTLSEILLGSGLAVVVSDTEAVLVVSALAKEVAVAKVNEEFERDLGEAALEVLAILLYEGPSTRSTIDYIRGVNSSSSLRNLLSRGLVERAGNPADGREYVYRATTETLAHLGVTEKTHLPEYGTISPELTAFKAGLIPPHHGTPGSESAATAGADAAS